MKPTPDERPVLLCRVDIPPRHQAEVDGWMPKHFDDSLYHDAVTSVGSYEVLHDWRAAGLPAVFNGQATRFIPYVATDLESLVEWVDSPVLKEAIDDGVDRESQYPALEDEPFNGSIMEVMEVRGPVGEDLAGRSPILVERFHVGDDQAAEFDAWLNGPYLAGAEKWPGVVRVRTFRAAPGIPQRWPYTRYQGKGNRMLWADLEEGVDVVETARSDDVRRSLADSLQWDLRLAYVVRDAGRNMIVRTKADIGT
jgi:hypothetical protein